MTYDASDGYVVAVALNDSSGPNNDTYGPSDLTWKFSGGNWSVVPTTGQVPATLSPGLVYDARDEYVLLYGGRLMDTSAPIAPVTNQTWAYHAGVWTNLSAHSNPAPYAVDFANPVYDAADGYVLLYNEIGITPTDPLGYLNTTWTYAGGAWSNITATAGTPPAMLGSMTYDAADGYVLYFGGYTWSDELTNATWTFQAGVWTNVTASVTGAPSARMNFGIAYDNLVGSVILYGGLDHLYWTNASQFSYETWAYAAGSWTLLSSNGTIWSIQTMVYDVADKETVLLGSNSSLSLPQNVVTWVYTAGSWVVAAPLFLRGQWVTDVGHPLSLVVTQSPNGGGLSYQYVALPPGCAAPSGPDVSCVPSSPGTFSVSVTISDGGGFLAQAEALVVVNPAPAVVSFVGTGPVGEVGISTGFSVSASLGTGVLSYAYQGLPEGCLSTNVSSLQCVPTTAGTYTVTAEVTDVLGASASATDTLQVVPSLAVTSLVANRTGLDVGEPISMSTTVAGGDGPVDYAYAGLPEGCGSTDTNGLTCRPSAVGAYSIGVTATDALGAIGQGAAAFVVNALPSVVSVVPSNSTVVAGGTLSVSTTIAGGTAPYLYRFAGLPGGCVGSSTGSVECAKISAGNYTLQVTVIDSTGAMATGTTRFTVLQAPASFVPPVASAWQPGFWVGFAVAAGAIAIAVVLGARRLYLTRQGEAIVRGLSAPDEPTSGPTPREPLAREDPDAPHQ
jgi:hypothetical protein